MHLHGQIFRFLNLYLNMSSESEIVNILICNYNELLFNEFLLLLLIFF